MKQLIFLLLFLGTGLADESPSVQTHDMYNNCKIALRMVDTNNSSGSGADLVSGEYCVGYLRGVADGMEAVSNSVPIRDVSTEALIRSFVNYVNAHPAEMDAPNITIQPERASVP